MSGLYKRHHKKQTVVETSYIIFNQNDIFMLHQLFIEHSLLKFDESTLSIKLSDDVRFEGLKVYFSKIKD